MLHACRAVCYKVLTPKNALLIPLQLVGCDRVNELAAAAGLWPPSPLCLAAYGAVEQLRLSICQVLPASGELFSASAIMLQLASRVATSGSPAAYVFAVRPLRKRGTAHVLHNPLGASKGRCCAASTQLPAWVTLCRSREHVLLCMLLLAVSSLRRSTGLWRGSCGGAAHHRPGGSVHRRRPPHRPAAPRAAAVPAADCASHRERCITRTRAEQTVRLILWQVLLGAGLQCCMHNMPGSVHAAATGIKPQHLTWVGNKTFAAL